MFTKKRKNFVKVIMERYVCYILEHLCAITSDVHYIYFAFLDIVWACFWYFIVYVYLAQTIGWWFLFAIKFAIDMRNV